MEFNSITKQEIISEIKKDWTNGKVREMVFNAYNQYQEDERNGVDYIFDINNENDLISCIKGGMTAKEIANIYNSNCRYFFFGVNYTTPNKIIEVNVEEQIKIYLDEIVTAMMCYPYIGAYKELYSYFITTKILSEEYIK